MRLEDATRFINDRGDSAQKAKFVKYLSNAQENDEIEKELFKSGIDKGAVSKDAFYGLICMVNSYALSLRVLHHHITGTQGWFENHPKLADFYGDFDDLSDWLVETYISLGGVEPTSEMALEIVPTVAIRDYSTKECLTMAKGFMEATIAQMDKVKPDLPDYLASEMESKQADLHTKAMYMLKQALASED